MLLSLYYRLLLRGRLMHILVRVVMNGVALFVAAWVVPGIRLGAVVRHSTANDWVTLGVIALILAVVNAAVRPIMILLTLPLTLLTLGLFLLVVNALMLMLTARIAEALHLGFHVSGFKAALLGALVVWLVNLVLTRLWAAV